ncbi:SWI/SNF complex component SNF12 homolog [Nicotiana tabacum]|uniref:SWI/SNF complex component SNF12 homolog n=2 Tax=Nicotiana TaxID=4085 RepID=A0A1S4AG88_TOBAC|nr:PREDICTED: SWI/SNF complex component SNF12 homolog [Nicotiana sylvestris]XP_016475720.1 PREDICTED: SWI/SNF complex component SNF12 homolog [Nicotiana tabacum]
MNNNNTVRNVGLGNSGPMQIPQSMPMNHNQPAPHLFSQSHAQRASQFPGHFQLSEPQSQRSHAQFQGQAQAFSHFITSGVNTNIGVSSPATSTPNTTGGTRKVLQRPTSRAAGSSGHGQATASPLKTMELTPAVRRKKRKVSDKCIPDKVAANLPESVLYSQLLELEARVDAALCRKKIDMLESLKDPPHVQKTLRIYVFNTSTNQTPPADSKSKTAEPPSWSIKIFGRILGDGPDRPASEMEQKSGVSYPKFSSFFKKITVYLDQSLYPDNHVILWDSSRAPVHHDGFEIKRKGDKDFTAIIRLEMNYMPEKFKLSPALQEVLGIEVGTRARVLAALWYYVKSRKLQISDDTSSFTCDPPLRKVFGEEKLKFSLVSQKINPHLTAPQPIHLEHRIKLSGSSPAGNTCYDVLVDVPFTLQKEMSTFLSSLEKNKEIDACDEAISTAIKKIHEHQRRRAFFLGFSQSPADFINALVASQARDLKLVSGDSGRDAEMERRSEFYNQSWTEDAVIRYLNRKHASGTDHSASK